MCLLPRIASMASKYLNPRLLAFILNLFVNFEIMSLHWFPDHLYFSDHLIIPKFFVLTYERLGTWKTQLDPSSPVPLRCNCVSMETHGTAYGMVLFTQLFFFFELNHAPYVPYYAGTILRDAQFKQISQATIYKHVHVLPVVRTSS